MPWLTFLSLLPLLALNPTFSSPSINPIQVATVTSAVKLENEQQFMIAKKIQEMTGAKNIKLKPEVDPSLLGGFVVTYGKDGSGFIDMSVAGQIATLKNEVVVV